MSLSPDGSRLAYWANDDSEATVATRVVVQNLVDGTSVQHDVDAEFGVSVDSDLVWIAADRLLVTPVLYTDAEHSGGIGTGQDWFTVDADGAVGQPAETEFRLSSNVVAGRFIADRDSSEEVDRPDHAVVDVVAGGSRAVTLPESDGTSQLLWDGDETLAATRDSTPTILGDNDVEVVFGRLAARVERQPEGDCALGANCVPPTWVGTGTQVDDWTSLVGWRDGDVVVNRLTTVDVVAADGAVDELVRLREGDGSADTSQWGRGGAVQGWAFASDVLATAESVDAVEPATDLPRAVLSGAQLVVVWAAGLGLLLLAVGTRATRRRDGNA